MIYFSPYCIGVLMDQQDACKIVKENRILKKDSIYKVKTSIFYAVLNEIEGTLKQWHHVNGVFDDMDINRKGCGRR